MLYKYTTANKRRFEKIDNNSDRLEESCFCFECIKMRRIAAVAMTAPRSQDCPFREIRAN